MLNTLNQTDSQIPLPEDIQARIENAKNNITLMEAETARLQKLSQELDNKIKSQHSESKALEESISKLELDKTKAIDSVTSLKVNQVQLEEKIKEYNEQLKTINEASDKLNKEMALAKAEMSSRVLQLQDHEDNINKRELDLLSRENAFAQKVDKLKRAIE